MTNEIEHTASVAAADRVIRITELFSRTAGAAAACFLVALASLMLLEIVWRFAAGQSLHFTWEYSAYAMSAVFLLGASYTLGSGTHVRVTAVLDYVPPGVARAMEVLGTLIGFLVAGFLTWALFDLASTSFRGNVVSFTINRVPLAIPQFVLALGATLLSLQFLARFLRLCIGYAPEEIPAEDDVFQSEV